MIGEWNHLRIVMSVRQLRVELNGHETINTNIDTVRPQEQDPSMSDVPNESFIGLQNHGTPVEFGNIRIRQLRQMEIAR